MENILVNNKFRPSLVCNLFYYLLSGSNVLPHAMWLLEWRSGLKSNETIRFLLPQRAQNREKCQSSVTRTVWGTRSSRIHGKIQRKEEDGGNTVLPWTVNKCSGWATYLGQHKYEGYVKTKIRSPEFRALRSRGGCACAQLFREHSRRGTSCFNRSRK
jgi:hypothetical protein